MVKNNGYFIQLRDKNESPYSLSNPESYLSARAIERRLPSTELKSINTISRSIRTYINGVEACRRKKLNTVANGSTD
jgi:hypothetical protein